MLINDGHSHRYLNRSLNLKNNNDLVPIKKGIVRNCQIKKNPEGRIWTYFKK